MTTYCVHLGFDWNSYLIGTPWGSGDPGSNYWLQYALTSSSDYTAANLWQFIASDTINFVIWDLTDWGATGTPGTGSPTNTIAVLGGIGANSLDGTTIYGSSDSVLTASYQCAWSTYNGDSTKPCIEFTSTIVMSYSSGLNSPWGPASGVSTGSDNVIANVIFAGSSVPSYKLNFQLQVSYNSSANKVFIADPETYIGSGKKN